MAEAELMAERMNVNIAAWCHFYWNEINPGAEKFYQKSSERAFNQVLRHEINECTWDSTEKVLTTSRGKSEMASIEEFEQLDWVKALTQGENNNTTKSPPVRIDLNVAFNFQDNFSVGTIHGNNMSPNNIGKKAASSTTDVLEIHDNDDDDDVSIITTKTNNDATNEASVGSRVASGSNPNVGPSKGPTQPETAHGGSQDSATTGSADGVPGGPGGK